MENLIGYQCYKGIPKFDNNIFSCKGGCYSPSKINIVIGQMSLIIWLFLFGLHFGILIKDSYSFPDNIKILINESLLLLSLLVICILLLKFVLKVLPAVCSETLKNKDPVCRKGLMLFVKNVDGMFVSQLKERLKKLYSDKIEYKTPDEVKNIYLLCFVKVEENHSNERGRLKIMIERQGNTKKIYMDTLDKSKEDDIKSETEYFMRKKMAYSIEKYGCQNEFIEKFIVPQIRNCLLSLGVKSNNEV